jgi:D-lactate dehydrogenase
MVRLVVERYDGALKAEHGTGRNMAPFVEAEWGAEGLAIMKRLKALVDPEGLLNPGVIINPDPQAHVTHVKPMPAVEEEVDKCIECGFCEPKCPSRDLTLTPRQRIVVRREMVRLTESQSDGQLLAALEADFPYMALDTCAVDGLCATACPVGIDTGQLTKRFRRLRHSPAAQTRARRLAENFSLLEGMARFGLRTGHVIQSLLGAGAMTGVTRALRAVAGKSFPQWSPDMPRPSRARPPATTLAGAQAVYFPSCISRVMGHLPGEPDAMTQMEAFVTVASRAGFPLWIPEEVAGTCCGLPFSSKGYDQGYQVALNRAIARFWQWSEHGRLPVVVDTSPCTFSLVTSRPHLTPENQRKFDQLRILDSIAFVQAELLPRLTVTQKLGSVALHPVCSVVRLNLTPTFEAIARACSQEVIVPLHAGCCGFAGDQGFVFPELTASATRREAAEIEPGRHNGHFSSSRTCEIAMTRATDCLYRSYIYLVEHATR